MTDEITDFRAKSNVQFWIAVLKLKSRMGGLRNVNLVILALQLLSIPASNEDREQVFSSSVAIYTCFK